MATGTGTVKWFSDQKGYGFIVPDEGGQDLFIHHTNIMVDGFRSLKDGQKVEFDSQPGRKGPEATKCKPIGEPPAGAGGGQDRGRPRRDQGGQGYGDDQAE